MSRYILTPEYDPAGTPVFCPAPERRGKIARWADGIAIIATDDGMVDVVDLFATRWLVLTCDDCRAEVLNEAACPNDTRTCVDCCPCHRPRTNHLAATARADHE